MSNRRNISQVAFSENSDYIALAMEDNSIKSSTSRNLTPNQLTAIRTPVSMVNSTRADSMSSKSIPLTKKITNIAHITKTGFNGFHRKGPQKVNQDNYHGN